MGTTEERSSSLDGVGLQFQETMAGFLGVGEADPRQGDGQTYFLRGHKEIHDDPGMLDVIPDMTTLFIAVRRKWPRWIFSDNRHPQDVPMLEKGGTPMILYPCRRVIVVLVLVFCVVMVAACSPTYKKGASQPPPPPPPKPPVVSKSPPPPIYKNGGPLIGAMRNGGGGQETKANGGSGLKTKANGGSVLIGTPEQKLPQILWNLWAEESPAETEKPRFDPVSYLAQGENYLIALDLSSISYKKTNQGTYTRPAGVGFEREIQNWLDAGMKTVTLTAVILVDPLHFETPGQIVETLQVDLGKIRRVANQTVAAPDNIFEFLKQKDDPDFVFGRVAFRIRTRAGQAGGLAPISLSLWANNRPVDEVSVQLCVAPDSGEPTCRGIGDSRFGLKGVDSLKVASETAPFPDAALHFLELGPGRVIGVFRRNDTPESEYFTWPLNRSPGDLRSYLSDWVRAFVATRSDEAELRKRGLGLYNVLFPPDDPQADRARSAWEAFIRPHLGKDTNASEYRPPSIFVRLIQQVPDPPLLIPLGLTAVSLDNSPATFLGFLFRIETPLDIQSYRSDNNCLSRWVTVVTDPPGDDALRKATSRIERWVPIWEELASKPFKDMRDFGDWIGERQTELRPTAIVILSHHANNRIWSNPEMLVLSSDVMRKFSAPSIAVLSGCGTGGPGAVDFVRRFNRNGIGTIIATSTEVDPYMAGDFLNELAKILVENQGNERFNLGVAYFKTIQIMRTKTPPDGNAPYEARVLEFTLLGNGNVRLCPPNK